MDGHEALAPPQDEAPPRASVPTIGQRSSAGPSGVSSLAEAAVGGPVSGSSVYSLRVYPFFKKEEPRVVLGGSYPTQSGLAGRACPLVWLGHQPWQLDQLN